MVRKTGCVFVGAKGSVLLFIFLINFELLNRIQWRLTFPAQYLLLFHFPGS